MPRLLSAAVVLCALNLAFFIPKAHAATVPSGRYVRVMVELQGPPLAADGNLKVRDRATLGRNRLDATLPSAQRYSAALAHYQGAEIQFLQHLGVQLDVLRQMHVLFNGFAANVRQNQVSTLKAMPNVAAVLPDLKVVPMDERSLPLINVPSAWPLVGGEAQAGRKIFIADLDTGIDVSNPCFNASNFPAPPFGRRSDSADNLKLTNNKVIVARAFGSSATGKYSAADAIGHGTFTAAVEACDANTATPLGTSISGVAPGAYLGNYNVFAGQNAQDDSGFQDPVISGMEAALQDGADVANLSLGSVFGPGDTRLDAESLAVKLATAAGMVIVVAAGNAGPTPLSVSSPGTAADAISVGATTNARTISSIVSIAGSALPQNLSRLRANQGSHPFTGTVGPAPLVYVGLGRKPGDDTTSDADSKADDFAGKDLHGKIALIQRGSIFFEKKINNAADAGAIGVIIFDNHFELNVFGMDVRSATLPAMSISQSDGQSLLAYVKDHSDAKATLDSTKISIEETPNVLSDFSARGFGPDYSIKPDLVAPGQDIYAATENESPNNEMYDPSGFTTQQGTSFSAPHVAGAVALILQKHPSWKPAIVKAVLMETASQSAVSDPTDAKLGVMEIGSGLANVQSAISATADILPASVSLGQVNLAAGAASQTISLTLNDLGGGSGQWQGSLETLHGAPGLTISVPGTVTLSSGSHANLTIPVSIASTTPSGDYDGYVVLRNGDQSLHVPYFVHVVSKAITPGSVLLVDDTTTRFQPEPPAAPIQRHEVSQYYENALTAIGKTYTYWDEGVLGAPSLADLKRASAAIYFTADNLNGYASQNGNYQALLGPLSPIDLSAIHAYLDAGGRVFVTGKVAALSDLDFSGIVLGGAVAGVSMYDNQLNDKSGKGGMSPPQPSAVVDTRVNNHENKWLFSGMKGIDFSTKGDGAGTNVAVNNTAISNVFDPDWQTVGVTPLQPYFGHDPNFGDSFGTAVLRTTDLHDAQGAADVGIASSDEPSFTHAVKDPGRSMLFSFGFEGINDNTGYATRAQVLKRIFDWFDDKPVAAVASTHYAAGRQVQLKASLSATAGVRAVQYQWQLGKKTLKSTAKSTKFTFKQPGKYRLRVLITDSLGHTAVSAWKTITVR